MHAVVRNAAQRLKKYTLTEFGVAFDCNRVYFAIHDNCPVTVEEYVQNKESFKIMSTIMASAWFHQMLN